MSKKRLRVGVIGTGAIAVQRHLPYWQELETEGRVELVGVCDPVRDRAIAAQEKFGAKKAFARYRQMIENDRYDIIDICTHNRWHCPITVDALNAGAHVLVEKPMAMSVKEAAAMLSAARKARRKLMVAQHMRFEPPHEKLKEVAERGTLGRIYTAGAVWLRRRGIPGWGRFHIRRESLGGPLIDIGVHMMDLCVWLMGFPKPKSVLGKVYRMFGDRPDLVNAGWGEPYPPREFDVEDYAIALVRFEGDITMRVEVSWAANIPEEYNEVRVLGDRAGLSTNPLGVFGYQKKALTSSRFDWLPREGGHRGEVRHFTECVERDLPVRVKPEESLVIQKIIDAIYESSKRNKEVLIP